MKLRKKKTGEVFDALIREKGGGGSYSLIVCDVKAYEHSKSTLDATHFVLDEYDSLAKLNAEWEDAPDEEWRDVLGFEELYQVSNFGNVRTVKRGEATVMAQEEQRNGYLSVHLRNRGIERRASVHRLVAEAFIPNPDGLRDVNHKNGIKTDNRLENLEWMSHSDNIKHQYQVLKTGRYGHLYKLKDPLIKDEKIRKAVRAWAEAQGLTEVYCTSNGYEIYGGDDDLGIQFEGEPFSFADRNRIYTIEELCGEDEE